MARIVSTGTRKKTTPTAPAPSPTRPLSAAATTPSRVVEDVESGDGYIRVEPFQGKKRISLDPVFAANALSGTSTGLHVTDTAGLAALDDSRLPHGTQIGVASLFDIFYLDRESALDPEPAVVVTPMSGEGRWIRSGQPAISWRRQTAWFIDWDSGNDENDGSEEAPLKTQAEWVRRVGPLPLVAMTLTFLAEVHPEWMIWSTDTDYDALLTVRGVVSDPIFTGAMDTVQVWSSVTNQDGQFTEPTLPVSWTASAFVGAYARMTSGDANGLVFWIAADLGTKRCRFSYIPDMDIFDVIPPAEGNTYTLHTISKLTGQHIFQLRGHGGQMLFEDLEFGSPSGGSHQHRLIQGNPIFLRCKTHGLDVQLSGGTDMWNCWVQNGSQTRVYERGMLKTFCGVIPTGVLVHSGLFQPELTLIQGPITLEGPDSLLVLFNSTPVYSSSAALNMATMSRADLSWGRFFGAAATVGIKTGSWCQVTYDFLPTITAPTDLSFGGTVKTYAELPYVDTVSQSGAVAWTE